MKIYEYPDRKDWPAIVGRQKTGAPRQVKDIVSGILSDIREYGDAKVLEYVKRLDGFDTDTAGLRVPAEEIEAAAEKLDDGLKEAVRTAAGNIRRFHEAQKTEDVTVETMPGVICRQKNIPIDRVGLYIPGGTAPLFSTVLMLAIPARLAGCRDIILATPARNGVISPAILYAAKISGVSRILKVGGAQAIAAFAYGTESVGKRDKIFGPGNGYVTEAKRIVSAVTAIDMPAGPSEVMVAIDKTSNPAFAAADLLSQAEHGKDSQAMLVIRAENRSEAEKLHKAVDEAIGRELGIIGRHEYMLPSLSHSYAFPAYSDEELAGIINAYAPEHLIISTENPDSILPMVENAGSIFLGQYTPEAAGDYASGTNHTLPTSGWACSSSGVSIDSFIKKITVQRITRKGLEDLSSTIECMAANEGLDAHGYAVKVRVDHD